MKKIAHTVVFAVFLLCAPGSSGAPSTVKDTLTVATYNAARLASLSSGGSAQDDPLFRIAGVVKKYDFVALQGFEDTAALDALVGILRGRFRLEYAYAASPKTGPEDARQIIAFLYRPGSVTLVKNLGLIPDPERSFVIDPFAARFKAGHFEFTAIGVHSFYGYCEQARRTTEYTGTYGVDAPRKGTGRRGHEAGGGWISSVPAHWPLWAKFRTGAYGPAYDD